VSVDDWLADTRTSYDTGTGSRLKTEGYGGHPMRVYVHRREPDRVADWLREAGFTVTDESLPEVSVRSGILFGRRPGGCCP
jgi:hypothetical protein